MKYYNITPKCLRSLDDLIFLEAIFQKQFPYSDQSHVPVPTLASLGTRAGEKASGEKANSDQELYTQSDATKRCCVTAF